MRALAASQAFGRTNVLAWMAANIRALSSCVIRDPLSDIDADAPQCVTNRLPEVEPREIGLPVGAAWARRPVHRDTAPFQHSLHAEDVVSIANDNARMKAHAAHNLDGGRDRLARCRSFRFRDDRLRPHSVLRQVSAAHLALGIDRVATRSSSRHNIRGETLQIENEGM